MCDKCGPAERLIAANPHGALNTLRTQQRAIEQMTVLIEEFRVICSMQQELIRIYQGEV